MRWSSLFLLLFVAAFLFACGGGGDEYGDVSDGGTTEGGGGAAKKADEAPPKKDIPRVSPQAAELLQSYQMADNIPDYDAKKKKALERAEFHASQTIVGDANFYLGLLWRIGEEHGKAADAFVKFVNACPDDKNFKTGLYYAGIELAKDGRVADAAAYVKKFGQKFPTEKKLWKSMASTVGYAMLENGDFEGAIAELGTAAELGDKYAGEEMIRCMWARAQYEKARTKANDLKAQFEGDPEQKRYDSVADLAARMGKAATALDVEGFSKDFDTSELSGKVYLVYFWSVRNRGTANKNERLLTKLYDRYAGEGLEIIGISKHSGYNLETGQTDESMGAAEEIHNLKVWVYNFKTPWILGVVGDEKLFDFFGYRGNVPAIAVIGKKGNLRYFRDSSDEQGYTIIAKVIEKLLEE